jgi:non-ribosomal peptide synthetase component F
MKTPSRTRLQVHTALREDGGVSAASTSSPPGATIHGLFEEQADRTPEAVALLDRDRHWSYAELNRRANLIARRLEEMGEASVVLTEAGSRDSLPATNAKILTLDDVWAEPSRIFSENPSRAIGPEDLAYVMYTSGSTGRPKGVRIPHRGVVRLVRANDYARFGPEEVFLQFAPISFDASTLDIWGSLLNGARLQLASEGNTDKDGPPTHS